MCFEAKMMIEKWQASLYLRRYGRVHGLTSTRLYIRRDNTYRAKVESSGIISYYYSHYLWKEIIVVYPPSLGTPSTP
jgi:hypothetical protein